MGFFKVGFLVGSSGWVPWWGSGSCSPPDRGFGGKCPPSNSIAVRLIFFFYWCVVDSVSLWRHPLRKCLVASNNGLYSYPCITSWALPGVYLGLAQYDLFSRCQRITGTAQSKASNNSFRITQVRLRTRPTTQRWCKDVSGDG